MLNVELFCICVWDFWLVLIGFNFLFVGGVVLGVVVRYGIFVGSMLVGWLVVKFIGILFVLVV